MLCTVTVLQCIHNVYYTNLLHNVYYIQALTVSMASHGYQMCSGLLTGWVIATWRTRVVQCFKMLENFKHFGSKRDRQISVNKFGCT